MHRAGLGVLLLVSACAGAPDPDVVPKSEWVCVGKTTERDVTVKVLASSLEEAGAEARTLYPGIAQVGCSPAPTG